MVGLLLTFIGLFTHGQEMIKEALDVILAFT